MKQSSLLLNTIYDKARKVYKTIVFPEGEDARIVNAAIYLAKQKIVNPILLGNKNIIASLAKKNKQDIDCVTIIEPQKFKHYTYLYDILKSTKLNKNNSKTLLESLFVNPLYFATLLVRSHEVDGCVAGAVNTTADVLKAAFSILGTKPNINTISGAFIMILENNKHLIFADCAVVIEPSVEQLADIAIASAKSAKSLIDMEPKIAMLSFSTNGSAKHKNSIKIAEATSLVKKLNPDLVIDGELQLDAAICPEIAKVKTKNSPIKGEANILIFPNLDAGNIGYKLVQRLANAKAIGPILQGIAYPMNDLSRGATVLDIVNMASITAIQD